jgi:deoxyribonuclease I
MPENEDNQKDEEKGKLLSTEERIAFLEGVTSRKPESSKTNIPLLTAILVAAAGLYGQAYVAWFNADSNRKIENHRLQQQLLLNAVKADIDQAKENLEFLLDTGLLKDSEVIKEAKIRAELEKGKTLSIPMVKSPKRASYSYSKKKLLENIYLANGQDETFYCGCSFNETKTINLESCGFVPRKNTNRRSRRLEWEHVMPASTFGNDMQCWKEQLCSTSNGKKYGGRRCCAKTSHSFKQMEADMHNMFPAIGEVNSARSNFQYGEVSGEPRKYGQCDIEIQGKVVEPDPKIRGDIARAWFYMSFQYKIPLAADYESMLREWHQQDPPTEWDRKRNQLIKQSQGNSNLFIEQPMMVEAVKDF